MRLRIYWPKFWLMPAAMKVFFLDAFQLSFDNGLYRAEYLFDIMNVCKYLRLSKDLGPAAAGNESCLAAIIAEFV